MTSFRRHWSVLLGMTVGAVLLPVVHEEWTTWRIERAIIAEQGQPVVQASATIIRREADAVVLHVTGVKLRDCKLVGTQAFSVRNSVMLAAKMERSGPVPVAMIQRPVGAFDMGEVKVWPVNLDAEEIVVYALHTCGAQNIEVRSTLARVGLNDNKR